MSRDTIGVLVLLATAGFFGLIFWMAVKTSRDDPSRWPNGPQPDDDFDAPFHEDNIRTCRVTALPVREPVWLFRPDSAFNAPASGSTGGDPVSEILAPLVVGAIAALVRLVLASSDRRWKVVVDRKDKLRFAGFHAIAVEIFNSESAALDRRDEIVKGWTYGSRATTARLSRRDVARIRAAAPAYTPEPGVFLGEVKPSLTPRARVVRRVIGTPLVILAGASTLFWLIGVVAPPFSRDIFITSLVMAAISAAITIGGWKLLALGR